MVTYINISWALFTISAGFLTWRLLTPSKLRVIWSTTEFGWWIRFRVWCAGEDHYAEWCLRCKGEGKVWTTEYFFGGKWSYYDPCWRCEGRGYHIKQVGI